MKAWRVISHAVLLGLAALAAAPPAHAATGLAMVCADPSAAGQAVNASCGGTSQAGQVYKVPTDTDLVRVRNDGARVADWSSSAYVWKAWGKIAPGEYFDTCTSDVAPGALVTGGGCTTWGMAPRAVANTSGSVVLSWSPPTANTDGSPITDLAGFNVYRGSSASNLVKLVPALGPGVTSFTDALPAGTYYYSVTAFTASSESDQPAPVSVTVTKVTTKPGQPQQLRVTVTVRSAP